MNTKKEFFWLFALPFLVFSLFFLLRGVNESLIKSEEQERAKPRVVPNTDLIERPQSDRSVKVFRRDATGKETLVFQKPSRPKSQGLFKPQYLALFMCMAVFVSAIILVVSIAWMLRGRRRQQPS
jgi:hypothetical protein